MKTLAKNWYLVIIGLVIAFAIEWGAFAWMVS